MPEGLLSPVHLIILFAILILLFGAKRLPSSARESARGIREFRGSIASINEEPKSDELPAASGSGTPSDSDGPKAAR